MQYQGHVVRCVVNCGYDKQEIHGDGMKKAIERGDEQT